MPRGNRKPIPLLDPALERPLVALQSALSGDALIKAVFTLLKRAVRCDFVNVCLRIVRREHGNIVYRVVDSRGRTFGIDLLEGTFFEAHPGMPTLLANPGIRFINTREVLPPDEVLHKMPFYRDVMQVVGFRHAAGMFFWEHPPQTPEAIFSLYRGEGQPDFNDEEVAVLARLYSHIDAALGRLRIIDKERAARDGLRTLAQRASRAICVLHWDLTVVEVNRAALELCARWNLGAASARLKPPPFKLPATLREACTELKARWRNSLRHHPVIGAAGEITVQHPKMPSLRATVSLRTYRSDPLGKPRFIIAFQPERIASAASGKRPSKSALATLAPRERDLIRLVAAGLSNQEIATETGKALGSVKNALHAVFRKVDVRSRSALIAQVGGG
jgi:DNA-binding CsgD family transcriptional regulator